VSGGSLRERKKRTTHQRIQQAALDLFARDGFHATTIAAIAQAADVAPRTVFLHFPTKEDLLFAHDSALDELERRLEDRAAEETALDALRAWIADGLRARDDAGDAQRLRDWERARTRRAIIDAEPTLRQKERGQLDRAERLIAAAIARDIGRAPDDLLPLMAASATVAVLAMLDRLRPADRSGPLTAQEGLALVDQVVSFLRGGMAAVTDA
jgi:AcrR family transcriptional regulator